MSVGMLTYTTAIDALRPFAAMYRSDATGCSQFYITRGTGCDKTVLNERDLQRAYEIVDAFDAQPENEPDAKLGADEVFGDSN